MATRPDELAFGFLLFLRKISGCSKAGWLRSWQNWKVLRCRSEKWLSNGNPSCGGLAGLSAAPDVSSEGMGLPFQHCKRWLGGLDATAAPGLSEARIAGLGIARHRRGRTVPEDSTGGRGELLLVCDPVDRQRRQERHVGGHARWSRRLFVQTFRPTGIKSPSLSG